MCKFQFRGYICQKVVFLMTCNYCWLPTVASFLPEVLQHFPISHAKQAFLWILDNSSTMNRLTTEANRFWCLVLWGFSSMNWNISNESDHNANLNDFRPQACPQELPSTVPVQTNNKWRDYVTIASKVEHDQVMRCCVGSRARKPSAQAYKSQGQHQYARGITSGLLWAYWKDPSFWVHCLGPRVFW